jgi:hydrogenase-1 operon protein HyaF
MRLTDPAESLMPSSADRTMLNSLLGEGEMCIDLEAPGRSQTRESSFPGVWWVRHQGPDGKLVADHIEVSCIHEMAPAHASDVVKGQVLMAERIEQMSRGSEK